MLAIDGPSGAGKGTVGQTVATRLGWHYLDSGALYRALALAARARGLEPADIERLGQLAAELDIRFGAGPEGAARVFVDGRDVSDALRGEQCGRDASAFGAVPEVRRALLQVQREARRLPGLVADGRDMGTVVFPDALVKIFLTASAEVRAERRYKQLKDKGLDVTLLRIGQEIHGRDDRDARRATSPLVPAADAHFIDTSSLTVDDVVDRVLQQVRDALAKNG